MEISTATGITRLWRNIPPTHYTLRVDSLSLLGSSDFDHYETSTFESGGYKWKLSLHPNGNKEKKVTDHISLYLVLVSTNSLPNGWEVNVTFKFFLYNYICNKYLTFQDAQKVTTRFDAENHEEGFDKLVPLATLKDPSNGYLLEDGCIFGVEVFVVNYLGRGECLTMIKNPENNIFTWKIPNFSQIDKKCINSDKFVVGGHNWKLTLYPKGNKSGKGLSISLYLALVDDLPSDGKVFAEFKLMLKSYEKKTTHWFCSSEKDWGFNEFLTLNDLNKLSSSYLVEGTLTVKVEIIT